MSWVQAPSKQQTSLEVIREADRHLSASQQRVSNYSKTLCFFSVASVVICVLSCTFPTWSPLPGSKHQSISHPAESTSAWQLPVTAWSAAPKDDQLGHTPAPTTPLTYLRPSGDLQIPEAEWQECAWRCSTGTASQLDAEGPLAPKIALRSVSGLQFSLVMLSLMVKIRFMTFVHCFKATEVHRHDSTPIMFFFFLAPKYCVFHCFCPTSPVLTGRWLPRLPCSAIVTDPMWSHSKYFIVFIASPATEQEVIIWRTEDSQDPARSLTFQITGYSCKYCRNAVLERTKHSYWNIAVPHHNHFLEEAEKWRTSGCLEWALYCHLVYHTDTIVQQYIFSGGLLSFAVEVGEANVRAAFFHHGKNSVWVKCAL